MFSAILLAGGKGRRMGLKTPKQFLKLIDKEIALYSFDVLKSVDLIREIIVVCDEEYRSLFQTQQKRVLFATPGKERQISAYHGARMADPMTRGFCIHDAARPFITQKMCRDVIQSALDVGASTVSTPLKFTIKKCDPDLLVKETPRRQEFREIQTPQALLKDIFFKGWERSQKENLSVTDDVTLAELIHHPVKLIEGSYDNIKITTLEDLELAHLIIKRHLMT